MRRKKSLAVRISGAILLCLLLLLPACAAAGDNTLIIQLPDSYKQMEEMTFTLYQLAEYTNGRITTLPAFSAFGEMDYMHPEQYLKTADNPNPNPDLVKYIEEKKISPVRKDGKDAAPVKNGQVTWEKLDSGVYLFVGSLGKIDGKFYEPGAWMILLRGGEKLEATVKLTERKPSALTVYKDWDDGNYSGRPTKIIVCLRRNGEHFADRELKPENKWSYAWDGLSEEYTWDVIEKTNLAEKGYKEPVYTTTKETKDDHVEVTIKITNTRPHGKDTTLPQTGLDWWPVAIMAIAGMTMFFLGWLRRRQEENDDEDAEA